MSPFRVSATDAEEIYATSSSYKTCLRFYVLVPIVSPDVIEKSQASCMKARTSPWIIEEC